MSNITITDVTRAKDWLKNNNEMSASCNLRDKVFAIEEEMLKLPNQVELPVNHHFSKGIYARELFIPKDGIVVGKIHKFSNMNVLLKGDLSVLVEGEIKRVQAPLITIASAGTKRVAYAHEDSIWLTIHGTSETDLGKIEEMFIAQSEQEFLDFCKREPQLPFLST